MNPVVTVTSVKSVEIDDLSWCKEAEEEIWATSIMMSVF